MRRSVVTGTRRIERVRCAIYTRKSSEEGLDQEFNLLQAQREACEAFINSQRHEGWVCLPAAHRGSGRDRRLQDRPAEPLARRCLCRTSQARRREPILRLSDLAPNITQAMLDGRQPPDLTADKLLEAAGLA